MSGLRNVWFLTRRELGVYFVSPMAYIIMTGLLLIFGWMFWGEMKRSSEASMPFYFSTLMANVSFIVVFITPIVTMRLLAEEKNRGTLEILMTSPVTELQVVLAKFLAAVLLLVFLLVPTLLHAAIAAKYGTLDAGSLFAQYVGVLLLGAGMFAIGLFVSSLCQSQVTAGVITFVLVFLLVLTTMLVDHIPTVQPWQRVAHDVVETLDPFRYLPDFLRGIVDVRPVTYFLSLVVLFNFLSVRALESRRWR